MHSPASTSRGETWLLSAKREVEVRACKAGEGDAPGAQCQGAGGAIGACKAAGPG